MRSKKYWILVVALAVVLDCVVRSDTDDLKPRQSILVGLKGVQVYVEPLRVDRESYGLTKERLQIDVELELRRYGIKVLSAKEVLKTPGQPVLLITVMHQPAVYADLREAGVSACSITIQLFEGVYLERNSRISCRATTWSGKIINAIPTSCFAETVREGLHDLTDAFINDYLAANSKEPTSKKRNRLEGLLKETKPKDEQKQ